MRGATVRYLDAARLRRALAAGLNRLISERQFLNRINVFPVADGDTGNNLAQTARAALTALPDESEQNAKQLMTKVADAALDGAQGNSGSILAQFFQSFAENLPNAARLKPRDLAAALSAAAAGTRGALENPREGTIITVMDAVATAAKKCVTNDFAEFLPTIRDHARKALNATTDQLDELRRAGVVDAGAHGFFSIIDACADFLDNGSIDALLVAEDDDEFIPAIQAHPISQDLTYRYCTECMVTNSTLKIPAFREELKPLGDSLVIAGSPRRMRIHIHSNYPEAVFDLAAQYGEVGKTKADDMQVQARSLHQNNREIVIVTDSAADIPESVMTELNIHMVPLRVQFGAESHLDKTGMSPTVFREELNTNISQPGTSQPTQGDLRRMFDFLGTHFAEVVSINLGSKLSGTYQGAKTAAARSDAARQITVLDSSNVSSGQGLLVARAGELAASGIRGAELHQQIESAKKSIRTFALVTDLTNAVKSGRVNPVLKLLANGLRITPVLTNTRTGKIGVCGYIPGRFHMLKRFARLVAKQMDTNKRWHIAIAAGDEQETNAKQLIELLKSANANIKVEWQTDIGPALGVHAGMSALVIAIREGSSR